MGYKKNTMSWKKIENKIKKDLKALNASEKQQNELQQRLKNMEIESKQMQKEFDDLQQKYNEQLDKFGYIDWTSEDIADWIVSIDRVQYYKYYNVLLNNLTKECIDGQ